MANKTFNIYNLLCFIFFSHFLVTINVNGLYKQGSPVKILGVKEFEKEVIRGDGVFLVEFFASWCGHCKNFAPKYEIIAEKLKGVASVVAVEDSVLVQRYNVGGFPTLKVFVSAKDSSSPEIVDYKGSRDVDSIVKFIREKAGVKTSPKEKQENKSKKSGAKSDVISLNNFNFDSNVMKDQKNSWLVEFFAPWCQHCQNLAPTYERVAQDLVGKSIKVAKVDATEEKELASRFGIQAYPTILFFPADKKSDTSAIHYEASNDFDSLLQFALKNHRAGSSVDQLISPEQYESLCSVKVCVLAFLPNILDSSAEERKSYIALFKKVIQNTSLPLEYLWTQGGDHPEVEEQLNLAFGFPALLATSVENKRYIVHRGSFTVDSIKEFISGLSIGRLAAQDLPEKLMFRDVEEWDGKDLGILPDGSRRSSRGEEF